MDKIFKFVLWFAGSLVGTFGLTALIPSRIAFSIIIALFISVLATKEEF